MGLTVAVLGTGMMGSGMARSLLRAGVGVRVWNRTREKAEPLADDGAVVCDAAADAASGADVIVTMLFDVDAVSATMGEVLPACGPRTVWVQTSTVGVGVDQLVDQARAAGVGFVDAPVVGTRGPAEKGELVVLPSGDPGLVEQVRPVFDAIGHRTLWVGTEPGAGSRLKLVVNAWLSTVVGGVAQSIALAGDLGLDPRLFLDAISGEALDCGYAQLKGGGMVDGDFEPSFALDGVLKDTELILDAAHHSGTHTGLLAMLADRLTAADRAGDGSRDVAAVVDAYRAGTPSTDRYPPESRPDPT